MFMIALGVVAVGALIINQLNKEAGRAYQNWEEKKAEVARELETQQRALSTHLASAYASYSFQELKQARSQSIEAANKAYLLLDDARQSLEAFGRGLLQLKQNMQRCFEEKQKAVSHAEKRRLSQELHEMKILRQELFQRQAQLKAEKNALYEKLQAFNKKTRSLKRALEQKREEFQRKRQNHSGLSVRYYSDYDNRRRRH